MPSVSFVIPCLNEAASIADVVHDAYAFGTKTGQDVEILVVDNASTDRSAMVATAAGARVIDEPVRGYGSAIRAGIAAATHDVIVIADADGQHDLSQTDAFLEAIGRGAHVVIGRRVETDEHSSTSWVKRRVGAPALSALGRTISGTDITDFHCGFRAASREPLQSLGLRADGMEFASEMIVRAHQAGLRLAEVPVTVSPPAHNRAPHLRPVRDGLRHVACLVLLTREPQTSGTTRPN